MVEMRSKKKLHSLCKQPITSISNDTTTTTQYEPPIDRSKDRLSELPDEVLVHILSFLPIEDAVRTLLLRRFGNLWTLLPTLVFDYCSLIFITNVMKYHKNPTIDRWDVTEPWIEIEDFGNNSKMLKCIDVALKKKPKVFSFDFDKLCRCSESSHIFINQSIVTLMLSNCWMDLTCQVNMGSLRRLELYHVEMVDEDMKALEVGCPCLQELFIVCPYGINALHFTAPNIERLEIEYTIGRGDNEYYSLNCPNLKFLDIKGMRMNFLEFIDFSSVIHAQIHSYTYVTVHLFELLHKKFQNAEVFHLENYSALQLEHCGNEKLAFQKNNWSVLVLKSRFQRSCLLDVCRLLRNSRVLEELILHVNAEFFCDCNMPLPEHSSPCEMRYLKIVTVRDFEKPCKSLVQLMAFVLKSAVVLNKLVIVCNNKDQLISSAKGVEFILELLSLPRASKNARVVVA